LLIVVQERDVNGSSLSPSCSPVIHETGTRISAVTPDDRVMGESAAVHLQRIRAVVGAGIRAVGVQTCHRVHTLIPSMTGGMIIAAGFGSPVAESPATALVPLVTALGSLVAEGTRYTFGTLVATLGRSLVTDEATPGFSTSVCEHA
jgi:hypothetical protein